MSGNRQETADENRRQYQTPPVFIFVALELNQYRRAGSSKNRIYKSSAAMNVFLPALEI
jgi:hypothetical protein